MLRNDLVFLVNAANDESNAAVANEGSYPAGGVLALGTWINQQLPDVEVIVRDGQPIDTRYYKRDRKNKAGPCGDKRAVHLV